MKVVVTDDGEGQLVADVTYPDGLAQFNNTYEARPDQVILEGHKSLNGKNLVAKQFEFELVDGEGNVLQTVTNNARGQFIFDALHYDTTGDYTYSVREVEGTQGGITYDSTVLEVEVSVVDTGEGQLVATASYVDGPLDFVNTYTTAADSIVLEASKVLNGQVLLADQFEFELIDEAGDVIQTVGNNVHGKVYFNEIHYQEAGKHTYLMREVQGSQGSMTYDSTVRTVVVEVVDNGEGQLVATANYVGGPVVFTNTYVAAPGNIVLEASKVLTGQTLVGDQFTFELLNDAGEVIQTVTNNDLGQVIFEEISYDKVGQHHYTIREQAGSQRGMTYDSTEFAVVVDVVDDREGKLVATASYSGNAVFENHYAPLATEIVVEADKVLTGRTLHADEFSFELLDENGDVIGTATNDLNGKVYFDALTYDAVGTYTYQIREVVGTDDNITYDETVFELSVDVVDEDGQLVATPTYGVDEVVFNNTYTPHPGEFIFEVAKELTGRDLAAGEFSFELLDSEGQVLQTVTNDADGKVYFNAITYTEVGTYNYSIREVAGLDNTVTYDDTIYEVSVEVTDEDGQLVVTPSFTEALIFTNTYTPSVSVGDYVWIDENRDGLQDETDTPLPGVVLTIVDADGNPVVDIFGNPVGPQTTDENGYYSFDNLPIDNTYTVRIDREASADALAGLEPTLEGVGDDRSVDSSTWEATSVEMVEDGQRDPTLDFGFVRPEVTPPSVSVGDYVWIDENRDGLQDETDTPLPGVVLTIVDADGNPVVDIFGNPVGPQTTDENGYYSFDNLPIDNTYTVRIDREASADALAGLEPTLEGVGDDRSVDSSTWEATSVEMVEDGQRDPTLDFGFVRPEVTPPSVSVGDYVWIDENRDGLQDDTDTPLPGVVLTIVDSEGNPVVDIFGEPVGPQTTDENGYYSFDNLPIDNTYTVRIDREASADALAGLEPTLEGVGDDRGADSSTWEATSVEMVEDGQRDPTLDFGFVRVVEVMSITGEKIWEDNDNESGTRPEFITVELVHNDEVIETLEVTPDENGQWTFAFNDLPILAEGETYEVREVAVSGYESVVSEIIDGFVTITNTYTPSVPPVTSAHLKAQKVLEGRELKVNEFEFEVVENDTVISRAKNAADGSVDFGSIRYTEPGTYNYIVREVQGDDASVTYDTTEYQVTVEVTSTDGQLAATVTYHTEDGEVPVFVNKAKPTDPVDPEDPEDPEEPTDPEDPEEPTDPEDPEEPTNPESPTTPTDPGKPSSPGQSGDSDLPSTGEESYVWIGLLVLVSGLGLVLSQRFKSRG